MKRSDDVYNSAQEAICISNIVHYMLHDIGAFHIDLFVPEGIYQVC